MEQVNEKNQSHSYFPPVVTVLGHVDHGKTTLLDAVRKTSIAERESGGITQKIGASSVEIMHDGHKRRISFIDTPGHEAFTKMRSRGANAADICLLIVSAADGVQPQTKESISLLKEANIPAIVVITKVDMPTKNVEKAKQQLMHEGILLEGLGGDVPYIEVSAKTGHNVKELLDLILLVADLHGLSKESDTVSVKLPFSAIVIESRLDTKVGPRATMVVKNGKVASRDEVHYEDKSFRVRTLINDTGEQVKEATIGDAVEVLGMTSVPGVGSIVTSAKAATAPAAAVPTKPGVYSPTVTKEDELLIILCADTQGSLEAITYSLPEKAHIVHKKTGDISEGDIMLGKSTGAIVLGFNVRMKPDVTKLAITEKVPTKVYTIIYEMIDEISDVIEGKRLALVEEVYGSARILAKFPYEKTMALGITVLDGRIARGDKIRIMRGDAIVGEANVASLRVGKNPTSKVEKGHEAGIVLNKELDFSLGDAIISHS